MNRHGTPNFDRLAKLYRWMEWASFGPWLGWRRCACLGDLLACRRVLVLGDGDGRFTARLLAANPIVRIDAVDASAAMLRALVRQAGPHADRVRTHRADARCWQPAPGSPYDAICTHFFLDCLTTREIQSLAATLRQVVSPATVWIVSEFSIPDGRFGSLVARPLVSALYRAFGGLTGLAVRRLPDHRAALREAGFLLQKRRTGLAGLLTSELWSTGPEAPFPSSKTSAIAPANYVTNMLKSSLKELVDSSPNPASLSEDESLSHAPCKRRTAPRQPGPRLQTGAD